MAEASARSRHILKQLLVSVGLFAALPSVAAAQRIALDASAWVPSVMAAEAKVEGGALPGTAFDLGLGGHDTRNPGRRVQRDALSRCHTGQSGEQPDAHQ